MANDRHDEIRSYLFNSGLTPVQTLADALGASLATVRRDLTELESLGTVERVRGGARIANRAHHEVAFQQREQVNLAAKRRIAQAAFETVEEHSSVFLDAGTTVLQLARKIRLSGKSLTIATNGIVVARELVQADNVTLVMIGGTMRAENMSTIGPLASAMLEGMWFEQLFLGVSAISDEGDISSYDADEAHLNARMIARSQRLSILADHSKFARRLAFSVAALNGSETLITDRTPGDVFSKQVGKLGTRVVVAMPPPGAEENTGANR